MTANTPIGILLNRLHHAGVDAYGFHRPSSGLVELAISGPPATVSSILEVWTDTLEAVSIEEKQ